LGYLLNNPLRRLIDAPEKLLEKYVSEGQTVLELGPGMGFYTIPLARRVGNHGKVIVVELQEKMRRTLAHGLEKEGLASRAEIRGCEQRDLGLHSLAQTVDVVLALNVIHETPDPKSTLEQLASTLRSQGILVVCEPGGGHCPESLFQKEILWCQGAGLALVGEAERGIFRKKAVFRKE